MHPKTRHERQLLALARTFARLERPWSAEEARDQTGLPLEYIRFTMRRLVHQGKVPGDDLYSSVATRMVVPAQGRGIISIRSKAQEELIRRMRYCP